MIIAKGLTKTFTHPERVEVIKGVDLEVKPGESLAIMGASGEGKSTLLHMLGTLEEASSGTLEIGGQLVTPRKAPRIRNEKIGFVFQSFFLMEDYTTLQNVMMPGRIGRKKANPQRARDLLTQVGLGHRIEFPTKLLSGGEKQRVAIARALYNDPEIILADEPTGNLDTETSSQIHNLLLELSTDKTIVCVTHDPHLASLCSRQIRLQSGQIS